MRINKGFLNANATAPTHRKSIILPLKTDFDDPQSKLCEPVDRSARGHCLDEYGKPGQTTAFRRMVKSDPWSSCPNEISDQLASARNGR